MFDFSIIFDFLYLVCVMCFAYISIYTLLNCLTYISVSKHGKYLWEFTNVFFGASINFLAFLASAVLLFYFLEKLV